MSQSAAQTVQQATSQNRRRVLIVDDEAAIRKTLEGIFDDEGFVVQSAQDGTSALSLLKEFSPDLIILDIWMPGIDGLELLSSIRAALPGVPVIMMSGHATIATAVKATHMGAFDFIEKPIELHALLEVAERALAAPRINDDPTRGTALEAPVPSGADGRAKAGPLLNSLVFSDQKQRGRRVAQRTLAQSAVLYGQGLHSGKKSGLILEPLPSNSGIHFVGVSETTAVPAHVDFVGSTGFATTVKLGSTQAGTIEHLMSALHAFGISNLLIKCNGEVPVLDGSARQFCSLFRQVGVIEQPGEWYEILITKTIRVGKDREWLQFEPFDGFEIDYTLEYGAPIGKQRMVFALSSPDDYEREIAPARTFGFVKDIGMLQRQGLALGGRFDNFVLIGEDGAINDSLRFQDEPVRHKILDAIGDVYLLGRRIRGRLVAHMTGHSDNVNLLRTLKAQMDL